MALAGDVTGMHEVEEIDEATALVRVTGGPALDGGAALDDVLAALKRHGRRRFVVDLSGAPVVNSKVLDALVRCAADLDPRTGAGLAVLMAPGYVRQVLEVQDTGGILLLADSRAEALEALPR